MVDKDKIEYTPKDDPTYKQDGYNVHVYPIDNEPVPDIIIWESNDDEKFHLWGYQGHEGLLVQVIQTEHNHPPDYPDEDCKKWSIYRDDPFPPLEEAPSTPEDVMDIAIDISDAPVTDKSGNLTGDDDE